MPSLAFCFSLGWKMALAVAIIIYIGGSLFATIARLIFWVDDRKDFARWLKNMCPWAAWPHTKPDFMDVVWPTGCWGLLICVVLLFWNFAIPVMLFLTFLFLVRYARRFQKRVDMALGTGKKEIV